MSAHFSLLGWLARLPMAASCIDGDSHPYEDGGKRYYALAEDHRGRHCPYPKLPAFYQRIFDARVRLAYKWSANYHDWQLRAEYLMLGWHWREPNRRKVVRAMRKIDGLFSCRRRGYSWHFHCVGCGASSFFSLKCKQCASCGNIDPPVLLLPRFSLLETLRRWERFFQKMHNRRWVVCRWCDRKMLIGDLDCRSSSVEDITVHPTRHYTEHECRTCADAAAYAREYYERRQGNYTDRQLAGAMAWYFEHDRTIHPRFRAESCIPF